MEPPQVMRYILLWLHNLHMYMCTMLKIYNLVYDTDPQATSVMQVVRLHPLYYGFFVHTIIL